MQSNTLHAALNKSITPPGGWASIIGIVCALVGNVLISIALNTQRYAHIQLQKEADAQDDEADLADGKKKHGKKTYGSVQEDIAEERSKKNAQTAPMPLRDGADGHAQTDNETSALIPSIRPPSSHDSEESTSTTHAQDEKSPHHHKPKNYLHSPYWWIGIGLMTIGEAGNFLAYGFAPASIVSPLGVVALVSNCIIAPFMLKERFRLRDLAGVVIAVGGAVTVVLSAKGSNPKLGPHEIVALVKRWEFLLYLGITTGAIVVLMVLSNKYGDRTIIIDIGLVGLFGGYTALSTKGVASLLSYRFFYVFTFPIAYVLVLVLVVTAIMQIKYLNRALQRFDSTQVIPTQFVTFTLFVVVGSAILYRDFEKTTKEKIIQFVGGVVLTFLGVWCITAGRTENNAHHDEEDGDEEVPKIALVDEEAEEEEEEEEQASRRQDTRTSQPRRASSTSDLRNTATASASSQTQSQAQSFVTAASSASTTSTIRPSSNLRDPTSQSQSEAQSFVTAASSASTIRSNASTIRPSSPQTQTTRPPTSHTTSTPNLYLPSFSPSQSTSILTPNPKTPPQPRQQPISTNHLLRPIASPRHASDMSLTPSTTSPRKSKYQQPSNMATTNRSPALTRHPSLVERVLSTPGPLTSPLSGGLSAIVADNLRRGVAVGQAGVVKSRRGSPVLVVGGSGGGSGGERGRTSERGRRPSALGVDGGSAAVVRGESVAVVCDVDVDVDVDAEDSGDARGAGKRRRDSGARR